MIAARLKRVEVTFLAISRRTASDMRGNDNSSTKFTRKPPGFDSKNLRQFVAAALRFSSLKPL
jgi:hypothetical protein